MTNAVLYENEPHSRWLPNELDALVTWAHEIDASDINFVPGDKIWIKVHGIWYPVTRRPLISDEIASYVDFMVRSSAASARIGGSEALDFSHEIKTGRQEKVQFRVNATGCKDKFSSGINCVMRSIPSIPPHIDTMNLEPEIMENVFPDSGLVLVTGVMGSGKSTLLSSILRHIIETKNRHVASYESPIEFDLMGIEKKSGPVIQMEVPKHLATFSDAVRATTRKAQDVVMIGESRDLETFREMLTTTEVGVAAYSTAHTQSVASTPARIINKFPFDQQNQIGVTLLSSLRMIIYQRLVQKKGGGRIPLREYLVFDEDIRRYLIDRKDKLVIEISNLVKEKGQTLLEDTRKKYEEGLIEKDVLDKIILELKEE